MDLNKLTKEELKHLIWTMENFSAVYNLYGHETYEKALELFDGKPNLKLVE